MTLCVCMYVCYVYMYNNYTNIHLLHPLLLNTKIYYTQGGNIPRGRRPSGIFATEGVINLVFNIVEGALTVLLFI